MKGLSSFGIFVLWLFLGGRFYLYLFEGWSLPSDKGLFLILIGVGVILYFINSSISKVESTLMEKISNLSSSEGNQKKSFEDERVKDGPFEEINPEGNLKIVGNFSDGKRVGDWKEYFDNGILREKGSYKLGKRDGVFQIFDIGGDKVEELVFELGVLKVSHHLKNNLLHGIQKYYDYEDGILLRTLTYEDGKIIEGLWKSYHYNGQISEKGNYLNGEKEGIWESYHYNGQIGEKGNFLNGKREGPFELYYENGQLKEKENYLNGEIDGPLEYYHENGQIGQKGNFLNGKREGPFELYYENGQLKEKGNYLNDKKEDGIWKFYRDNGQLREKGNYLNGKREGPFEIYDENGQLMTKENYLEGERDGPLEYFQVNGQLGEKGNYLNGKEEGLWEYYYPNGQLYKKGNYLNGQKDGKWEYFDEEKVSERTLFYKNGEIFNGLWKSSDDDPFEFPKVKGYFINGKREGLWESFHLFGQLHEKGNYLNGEKEGIWKSYNDKGQLVQKINYYNGKIISSKDYNFFLGIKGKITSIFSS